MTTITPPSTNSPTANNQGSVFTVIVQKATPALDSLTVGQSIGAKVLSKTSEYTYNIKTQLGDLSLQSSLILPKGSEIILQLQTRSPSVQFQIMSLNGEAPATASKSRRDLLKATQMPSSSNRNIFGQPPPTTLRGSILEATLMLPFSPEQKSSSKIRSNSIRSILNTPTQPTGREAIAQKIQKVDPTLSSKSTKLDAPISLIANKLSNGISRFKSLKEIFQVPTKAPNNWMEGSQMGVKVKEITLPRQNKNNNFDMPRINNELQTLSRGTNLNGTVIGSTSSGNPIIKSGNLVFNLTSQNAIPIGSMISFEIINPPQSENMTTSQMISNETLFASRKWPALEEVLQTLEEYHPGSTKKLINSLIPRPTQGMASSMIFYLSALKGGDIKLWFGENLQRLVENTRPSLFSRIKEDFISISKMIDEPTSGDWRVALIPVNTGSEIQQIRLLFRQNDNESDENVKSDARFIIDVDLTKFGRMQIDGLVREKGKSLDLIIRSDKQLNDTMKNDIRSIFVETTDLSGLSGSVGFQSTPANFINISDPTFNHEIGMMV